MNNVKQENEMVSIEEATSTVTFTQDDKPLKFCKDCKYQSPVSMLSRWTKIARFVKCLHPSSNRNTREDTIRDAEADQLVFGGPTMPIPDDYTSCRIMRKYDCGTEGKFFEAKK